MSKKSVETLSRTPSNTRGEAADQRPATLYLRAVYAEGLAHDAPFIGRIIPIGGRFPDDLVVGRAPEDEGATLAIEFDAWASRSHTRVSPFCVGDQKGLVISDLHSRNGTWVDGRRIGQRAPVGPGKVVRIGSTLFVVGEAPLDADGQVIAGPAPPPPAMFRANTWSMIALWNRVQVLARSGVGVLILGEMGTGKTHLARLIHDGSERASGPFVPHNCSAIPINLEEATLFGVVGGFIPTVKARHGLVATARGGTLFLDELADMPPLAQAKLLDAFDPSVMSYLPVGADARVSTDCRLICATNRDVFELAKTGRLRQDLLSRLVVGQLTVPPLRERREDLLQIFADELRMRGALTTGKPCLPNIELADAVATAHWTENVRGLKGLAIRLGLGDAMTPGDVFDHANRGYEDATSSDPGELAASVVGLLKGHPKASAASATATTASVRAHGEHEVIWPPRPEELLDLLAAAQWSVKRCAEGVGRRRETVARLMRQLFGEGGKATAQRAYRVWRESDRVPGVEELDAVFALFFSGPSTLEARAKREHWRTHGTLPGDP